MSFLTDRLKFALPEFTSRNFTIPLDWNNDEAYIFVGTPLVTVTAPTTAITTSVPRKPLTGICKLLHFNYLWELMLFWEIFLPVLGLLCFFRKVRAEPLSWIWLYAVLHANISVYVWCFYFIFTYNYCWQEIANLRCPDCSTVACTGGIFLGISLVISIIAAIANDQYYPDARMTPREARDYFHHLKRSHPEMMVILRTHLNTMGDWKRVKRTFYPQHWYDDTSYPDISLVSPPKKPVVYKVSMDVYAKTNEAKDDLRSFVWDFGQENNQTITLEDLDEYMIGAALYPAQYYCYEKGIKIIELLKNISPLDSIRLIGKGQNQQYIFRSWRRDQSSFASRYGIPRKQPTLTTDKTLRIYVRHDGELPVMLDWLLRFAWILNLIGLSGIVLHCLTSLQSITEKVHVEKRYGPRRPCDQNMIYRLGDQLAEVYGEAVLGGRRHPLDNPPPRYVSVMALNELEKVDKEKKKVQKPTTEETCSVNDDSGLPSYEEAMKREDDPVAVDGASGLSDPSVVCADPGSDSKRRKENVVKISMV